ncbi:MAG: biotin synthase BioB [Pseudomonadota bacterium]
MSDREISGLIHEVEERVLADGMIDRHEAELLMETPNDLVMRLLSAADRIRIHFKGNEFDACNLINARSGACAEDCAFCAQSAHYGGEAQTYDLVPGDDILKAAAAAKAQGASRFCTVTSGGALSDREFESLTNTLRRVRTEVDIAVDASLGFLDQDRAQVLREVGVTRYNHNLETARDHFAKICTTHTFDERVNTVKLVLEQGLSACCGGIIGMGETPRQRLDLAYTLKDLGVDCVPINILNPRPGTPLAGSAPLEPFEILKTIALFRLILPAATLKVAGGREINLHDFQGMALRSGANGMIIGGYLTTSGRSLTDDLRMVACAGYTVAQC